MIWIWGNISRGKINVENCANFLEIVINNLLNRHKMGILICFNSFNKIIRLRVKNNLNKIRTIYKKAKKIVKIMKIEYDLFII